MTLEQLRMFVAVAEREHLTAASDALNRTPSAVSAAIKALEARYGIALFNRVGRRIELTQAGRLLVVEARAILERVDAAGQLLADLAGLGRGSIAVQASQTIASYWLPPRLMRFRAAHPGIDIHLQIGNTTTVADAVANGAAEIGFVEGDVSHNDLRVEPLATDAIVIVVGAGHPWADGRALTAADLGDGITWVMREPGSGTRAEFLSAIAGYGLRLDDLDVALELPSNEAVRSAVLSGHCAAALSRSVAAPLIDTGQLRTVNFPLPIRAFSMLTHTQRHPGGAASAFAQTVQRQENP